MSSEPRKTDQPENIAHDLTVSGPLQIAAGLKAVKSVISRSTAEMGPVRAVRGLARLNQKGGIDCQSCAWPDPDETRTYAEFCESGAKALADEATTKRVDRKFWNTYSIDQLGSYDDHWINSQGRLTEPVIRRKDSRHFLPISWEEAFKLIGHELNALRSPDEAIFYTSGRTSNEAAFLYQLFVRQFGTNNLPDCSNMCHESSGVALTESLGLGKASVRLSDFSETDLVIVMGQNPGTNAPRMMSSLAAAKHAGANIIAINPLPEAGLLNFVDPNPQHYKNLLKFPLDILSGKPTALADMHLPVRIGGDMAVLKGLMKEMLERERQTPGSVIDHEFIGNYCENYAALVVGIDETRWEDILDSCGLSRAQIAEAADMLVAADKVITCWAMGLTQHIDAVATIQDIVNLHLLRGQLGKPGSGLCPVRGHSNVQGDRTMGITERPAEDFLTALGKEFKFNPPSANGLDTVESISAMAAGKAKVFFALGGNFAVAAPDTEAVSKALSNCRLTVQVLTKLNRTALVESEQTIILPCLGRSEIDEQRGREQFVTTESTMLNVQMSKGIFEPASKDLRSEPWIVAELAKATLGTKSTVDWDRMISNYDNIRDAISHVIEGCENYNSRVREPGGFYLKNPPRELIFNTDSGRAKFVTSKLRKLEIDSGKLLLTTIRSHDQFNTTIYGFDDRYRGIKGDRRVILLNEQDVERLGFTDGQRVDVTSHFNDGERSVTGFTIVPYPIPKGCAAAYFPEANPLVPLGSYATRSKTPASKAIVISLKATP